MSVALHILLLNQGTSSQDRTLWFESQCIRLEAAQNVGISIYSKYSLFQLCGSICNSSDFQSFSRLVFDSEDDVFIILTYIFFQEELYGLFSPFFF